MKPSDAHCSYGKAETRKQQDGKGSNLSSHSQANVAGVSCVEGANGAQEQRDWPGGHPTPPALNLQGQRSIEVIAIDVKTILGITLQVLKK